ncbi:MAG: right-handed parallel beta-helix repeat-containing protein [Chlamydiales bacterium]|nr:right-handed parallel beta-helix repeat-containing protein [Chlamydiales bacterium]
MIIKFCGKISFMAILMGAFTLGVPLRAEFEGEEQLIEQNAKNLSTLAAAQIRLKTLASTSKDPELLDLVKVALKRVNYVVQGGEDVPQELVLKALSSVQKVQARVSQTQVQDSIKAEHSSHRISDSSSHCDVGHDIAELESEVEDCCNVIQQQLTEILTFLENQFPCDNVQVINNVPVIINASGKYCVTKELLYSGTGAAITVTADNVSINFHNHSLTLTDPNAQGVVAQNVSEFTLENDIIQGSSIFRTATSAAVRLSGVQKATLTNIYTKNTTRGVDIVDSTDVHVRLSKFEAHEGRAQAVFPSPATLAGTGDGGGVWIVDSNGVSVDTSSFVGADLGFDASRSSFAMHVEGASRNIQVSNSTFNNWLGTFHILNVTGMIIDHCQAVASPISNFNLIQMGSCDEAEHANDVIIKNSNFIQTTAVQGFDGLLILGGSGCILENVLVDTTSQDILVNPAYLPSALHIGTAGCDPYTNLVATNCVIKGVNGRTVHIESGSNIVLDGCQISGGTNVNVFMTFASSCVVKNSMIFNGDSGFFLVAGAGTGGNSIENCQVFDNTVYGIQVSDQTNNHVSGNSVWGSRVGIYLSFAGFTETYNNTVCNNSVNNCHNVNQAQTPGASPAVVGSNVCCSP